MTDLNLNFNTIDLSALDAAQEALNALLEQIDIAPQNFEAVTESLNEVSETFAEAFNFDSFDTNAFSTIFVANMASMMVALELFKDSVSNISIHIDTTPLEEAKLSIGDIINGIATALSLMSVVLTFIDFGKRKKESNELN